MLELSQLLEQSEADSGELGSGSISISKSSTPIRWTMPFYRSRYTNWIKVWGDEAAR
jgi:hypothetical protein